MTESQKMNMEEHGYPFKFSIVMAVYKVEDYIREAIDSLLAQTLNFEENVQLILVNDGSPDNSGSICDEYKERFPHNIIVVHKENGGVSSARNAGLDLVQGRYVNFMDPDDKLSEVTLKTVYETFVGNEHFVDIVNIPIIEFEARNGGNYWNYKFKRGSRITNLNMNHKDILQSVSSSFFKKSDFKTLRFDTSLSVGEDTKICVEILLKKQQYYLLTSHCVYYHRIRKNMEFTTQDIDIEKHILMLKFLSLDLCKSCLSCYGYVPAYVQFTVMQAVKNTINNSKFNLAPLAERIYKDVICTVEEILGYIGDHIIFDLNMTNEYRMYLLKLKYSQWYKVSKYLNGAIVTAQNSKIAIIENLYTFLNTIQIIDNNVRISGYMDMSPFISESSVFCLVNDEKFFAETVDMDNNRYSLGHIASHRNSFEIQLPINLCNGSCEIILGVELGDGHEIRRNKLSFGQFSPLSREVNKSYYFKQGYEVRTNGKTLYIRKVGFLKRVKSEVAFLRELGKLKKPGSKRAIIIRILYYIFKLIYRKEIWLIFDKADVAGDNGEALYHYLIKKGCKDKKVFFSVGKNTSDYLRLKQKNVIIPYMSHYFKFLYLVSDKIISAYSHIEFSNPFLGTSHYYRDLCSDRKMCFLQHGVIHNGVGVGLNKSSKNLSLFVSSTNAENVFLKSHKLGYTDEIVLTGMPRFDSLYNDPLNIISIMPTWRRSLFEGYDASIGMWVAKGGFESSSYFLFYNALITAPNLLTCLRGNNYKLRLVLHPVMNAFLHYFSSAPEIEIVAKGEVKYTELFATSSLLVTDYSSIAFDYVYLRKPMFYAQFDYEEFRRTQYEEGYFSYESDGFGEVEHTLEGTINRIIEYVENDCLLKDKYRQRIENTFAFNDKNNCERVYQAILALN